MSSYGATPAQWAHWSLVLGLTEDLLPVVSNPTAQIAGESSLKTIGKVPSRYNARGLVVGIKEWTQLRASAAQIEAWSKRDDYGICLQTRSVRAIDIDVADPALVGRARAAIADVLGVLPTRGRPGSVRVALALRAGPGRLDKRVVAVRPELGGGAIELLASGQQFIVAGTHPSGGRYYWDGGEPDDIPAVGTDRLDACWVVLDSEFGDGSWRPGGDVRGLRHAPLGRRPGRQAGDFTPPGRVNGTDRSHGDDPVAAWLATRGWVVGEDSSKLWVACPWSEEHTVDTGGSATAWFVAGTGGYEQGHFECLHAHCARRTDVEFLTAVGFEQSFRGDFDDIAPVGAGDGRVRLDGRAGSGRARGGDDATAVGGESSAPAADVVGAAADGVADGAGGALAVVEGDPTAAWALAGPGRGLTTTKVKGKTVWACTATNLTRALATVGWWRRIRWDEFRCELVWCDWRGDTLVPWVEEDFLAAQIELEAANFDRINRELLHESIAAVAHADAFDSAIDWLRGLRWDGVPRVAGFLSDYFGAERDAAGGPGAWPVAVSEYLWTALAGRVLDPGCKADMAVILVGSQGIGKSSGLEALAPLAEAFATIDLAERDVELQRRLRGVVIAELVELRGLKSREHEAVKAWVSARLDKWRPLYKELVITSRRRFVIIGTTNEQDFLRDTTGNRRWLPVRVKQADPGRLASDREQLWAEGAALFLSSGVAWQQAEKLAPEQHEQYEEEEFGVEKVANWLSEKVILEATSEQVATDGLGWDSRRLNIGESKKVARVMRKLGWEQFATRRDGRGIRIWQKATEATDKNDVC